jgi:NAD(P)-dependent dehydrogenase (short-subunit alcohol dehydrogenase family)
MSGRLAGKVAIITGGASGIGAATARLFVAEGARVTVADRQAPVDARLTGLDFAFARTDVLIEAEVESAVAASVARWGRLDIAVASAGVSDPGGDTELAAEDWDRVMAINARGVFFLTKHAIPPMRRCGGGSIINISSAYGIVGAPGYAAYGASKGAVRTLTKATAIEHAAEAIRANSIHPGVIHTPMLEATLAASDDPTTLLAQMAALQPMGRVGSAEDVAWGCVYLASDEARFVTGIELAIDGGLIAR